MAQSIVYTDDLNGEGGAETVPFALDGVSYEIDLAEKNANRLRKFLAEFIAEAREVETKGNVAPSGQRARGTRGGAYGFNPATVRIWWEPRGGKNGLPEYKAQGRIPRSVSDAWEAAGAPGAR